MSNVNAGLADKLKATVAPRELALTLPADCYTSDAVYELEQAVIFGQEWVGVGRSDRWPEMGDYAAIDIAGVPVVVVRTQESLAAYANTCSHRSAQIMEGEGSCSRMRCPFHFWTYALDGRLVGAPSMNQTAGFDNANHGLHQFQIREVDGFVFVSLEESPPDIETWLGDFSALHSAWPLSSLVTGRRREFEVACNWKSFAEVFNEYYHLPYVHPTSIDDTYNEPDDPDEVTGAYASHFGTTEGTGGLLAEDAAQILPQIEGLEGRNAVGVRYSWLFPNMMIALGAEAMWMYEVYPDGPHRCRAAQVVCFPQSTIDSAGFEEKAAFYYERFDVAIAEDIPMLERQLAGMRTPFAKQGRYSYLEPSVARFASWYSQRLLNF